MKYDISKFSPCNEAVRYYAQHDTFRSAWQNCPRGDWMLWIARRIKVDERLLYRAAGMCAATVLHLMKDQRSRDAVQAAIDYADGKIAKKKLEKYRKDAACAFDDAYASAAHADTVAYAYDDSDAAYAAYAASSAAYAAYIASDAAASDAASAENRKQTADICRDILTDAVMEKVGDE